MREPPRLVLASASTARRQMLAAAGISVEADAASIDENAVRDSMLRSNPAASAQAIAAALAQAKAESVSPRHPGALVVGGDQILSCDGALLDKPGSIANVRIQLQTLRGRAHELHSAVCLVRDGAVRWSYVDTARMTMRDFSGAFLDRYVQEAGEAVRHAVGAYQLEGLGIQLFEAIEGDYFTVLGMPLLPLVAALRAEGVLDP